MNHELDYYYNIYGNSIFIDKQFINYINQI